MQTKSNQPQHIVVLYERDSVWSPEARDQVNQYAQAILDGLGNAGYQIAPVQITSPLELDAVLEPYDPKKWMVFNWFEEGLDTDSEITAKVATRLYDLGYTYTGADAFALQISMDKLRTKQALRAWDIPTPEWESVSDGWLTRWKRYPAIIKLANDHGSECLTAKSVVYDEASLRARVAELGEICRNPLMVSEYIDGPEIVASLLGHHDLEALPLLQVDYSAYPQSMPHVRTYESKWDETSVTGKGVQIVPASFLTPELENRVRHVAEQAYRVCGLRDYGRIDIRMRGDVPMVIDVNPNPDITADGSFVIAAELAGYDYAAMLDRIVRLALDRTNGNEK